MRTFEANNDLETLRYNELEIPHRNRVSDNAVLWKKIKKVKKYRNTIYNDIGYYFDKLNKFPKEYLSHEEIKRIYDTIEKYERAILFFFYFMDTLYEGLNEIREKFEIKKDGLYTKEQLRLISKISRKAIDTNVDREEEISRVKVKLEKICLHRNMRNNHIIFQKLFEELPFKNNSFENFITYFVKMVERIEANQWGEKTEKVAAALEKYSGVNYNSIRDSIEFFNEVTELEFENKYYYQKSISDLKKKIQKVDRTGLENIVGLNYELILKSINRVELYENKITKIFNDFSERYFRYVVFIAKRFINGKMSFSDIIQEGNIGLLKAVKKYKYEFGHKFITYAFYWIRQGITRAIAEQSRTIRIPIHVHQEYSNIKKIKQRLNKELWKDPDLKCISNKTGKSEKQINAIFEIFEIPLSLTHEIKRDTGDTLGSFIPDIKAIDPSVLLEKSTLKDEIHFHLNFLTKREAKLIEMRFGLKEGNEYTLEEVANEFQVSRERIRQIEVKALNRLKKKGEKRLKPYFDHNFEDVDYCRI